MILLGWALAQYPYLIVPDVTLASAAASVRTQRLLLVVLLAGLPILLPSLVLLFKIFKAPAPATDSVPGTIPAACPTAVSAGLCSGSGPVFLRRSPSPP